MQTRYSGAGILILLGTVLAMQGGSATAQTPTPKATGTTTPTPTATPAPSSTATAPTGALGLYQRSLAAMQPVLSVHSDGTMKTSAGLKLRYTGDCTNLKTRLTKKSVTILTVRAREWVRGVVRDTAGTRHLGAHLVVVASSKTGHYWIRKDDSHIWKRRVATANQSFSRGDLLYICLPLFAAQLSKAAPNHNPSNLQIEVTSLHGLTVWKVFEKHKQNGASGASGTSGAYLDPASLYWLRYGAQESKTKSSAGSRIQFDYSRYGVPVQIKAPH